jgi:DNA-binding MarR family transcriptional regulator
MADLDDSQLDLGLAALFAGLAIADEVQERLAAAGHPELRFGHGFVFQHLVDGPLSVGELAERMEMSQQGASKAVAELEALGYLERRPAEEDRRVRLVELTRRGRDAIEAARSARREVMAGLGKRLGERRLNTARRTLLAALADLGRLDAVRRRRVLPPR